MEKMTARDIKLLIAFFFVVLIGSLGIWYPKAKLRWEMAQRRLDQQERLLKTRTVAIKQVPKLQKKYEELCNAMPIFPEGKSVDTHWLPLMDNSASENKVNIAQRSIGKEENLGDVTELTIDCRDWEGRLDSLVWFLYDLETREDAMMDFRALTMRPSSKNPGILQGTFTLNCAYMRQPVEDNE